MSSLAQAAAIATAKPRPGLLDGLRRHLALINAAHARQARFAALPDEAARDAGLAPEDLLDGSAHDPALPFFFQRSFDR